MVLSKKVKYNIIYILYIYKVKYNMDELEGVSLCNGAEINLAGSL